MALASGSVAVTPARPRRVLAAAVVLTTLANLVAACSSTNADPSPAATTADTDPVGTVASVVLEQNFPDPDVLRVGDTYYAYATQANDGSVNVQMATSGDLQTWRVEVEDPLPQLPTWATNGRTWAPDVSAAPGGFVMYFTAHSVDPDLQCIGVARSTSPTGPFRPVGKRPLVCPPAQGGAIDAASFLDEDGSRYVLWKNDGNCCGKDTWLQIQPVSRDGLRLTGPPVRLVKQTEPWEGALVEAPTLVRHDDTYVLLYSANDYSGDAYATGYAIFDTAARPVREGRRTADDDRGRRSERAGGPGCRYGPGRRGAHPVPRLGRRTRRPPSACRTPDVDRGRPSREEQPRPACFSGRDDRI